MAQTMGSLEPVSVCVNCFAAPPAVTDHSVGVTVRLGVVLPLFAPEPPPLHAAAIAATSATDAISIRRMSFAPITCDHAINVFSRGAWPRVPARNRRLQVSSFASFTAFRASLSVGARLDAVPGISALSLDEIRRFTCAPLSHAIAWNTAIEISNATARGRALLQIAREPHNACHASASSQMCASGTPSNATRYHGAAFHVVMMPYCPGRVKNMSWTSTPSNSAAATAKLHPHIANCRSAFIQRSTFRPERFLEAPTERSFRGRGVRRPDARPSHICEISLSCVGTAVAL